MYIKVETLADLNTFNEIWMECWLEKGYMLDPTFDQTDRFIIIDQENREIGTIEFKSYFPTLQNYINTVFPFHEIEMLETNPMKVIEIDKVSILKKYRGKNLERLLSLFVHYTEFYQMNYCVVLLERVFYRALRNVYKIPIEPVGDQMYYKGDYVIPAIIHSNEVYTKKEDYPWIIHSNQGFERKPIFT